MNTTDRPREPRDYRFVIGLLAGTAVGVGLTLWLAPRAASEIRGRLKDSAQNLRKRAVDQYDRASARVGDAVEEVTKAGQGVRDQMADAVAHGARQVENFVKGTKSA